jgi:hypothetical protein
VTAQDAAPAAPPPEPASVQLVDARIEAASRGFHRERWIVVAALLAVLLAGVGLLAAGYISQRQVISAQARQIRSNCRFWSPLTSQPAVPLPGQKAPSRTTVVLFAGARDAYAGEGCVPPLPPAQPSLEHWAAVYRVPLSH